jgi:hypothetical protein
MPEKTASAKNKANLVKTAQAVKTAIAKAKAARK